MSSTSSSSTDASESSGSANSSSTNVSEESSKGESSKSDRSVELPLGLMGKKKRAPTTKEKYKTLGKHALVRKGDFPYEEFAKIIGRPSEFEATSEARKSRPLRDPYFRKGCPLCDGGTGKISREDMLYFETGKRFVERMKKSTLLKSKGIRLLAMGSDEGEPFWIMHELQELQEKLEGATGDQKKTLEKKYKKKVKERMEDMRSGIEEAALRYQAQRR